MKLTLGFSPCPNDTFIFDALVNKKIDTKGLDFEVYMEDIETLNKWGTEGRLDITKLSFPAFFPNLHQYIALSTGAALGKGVGPMLVANDEIDFENFQQENESGDFFKLNIGENAIIAIPGEYTTANFLLSYLFPQIKNKRISVLFSEIENAVLSGKADVGLLIHENRFTYKDRGLKKIADLGKLWEIKTGYPTPLACIAIKKTVDIKLQEQVGNLIKKSLAYSFDNYPLISPFVQQHAQAMSKEVMRQHIDLYVNDFSVDLGEKGKKAIEIFYSIYKKTDQAAIEDNIFVH